MKRFAHALVFMVIMSGMNAFAEQEGDVSVSCRADSEGESTHGYVDYRFTITNHSMVRPHEVGVEIPKSRYGYGNSIRKLGRTTIVPPGSTVSVSVFQPALQMYGNGSKIRVDGRYWQDPVQIPYVEHPNGFSDMKCLLMTRSFNRDVLLDRLKKENLMPKDPDRANNLTILRAESDVADWSENWLSYSRYDGVLLTGDDLTRMPERVRSALGAYMKCGGALLVTNIPGGTFHAPESWTRLKPTVQKGLTVYPSGFGECMVTHVEKPELLNRDQLVFIKEMWDRTRRPFMSKSVKDPLEANKAFPIIENTETKTGGLLLGMLAFVMIVGPVNLIILTKMKKKIWLLWTVPGISVFTCASIFMYSLYSEGLDSDTRTMGLTILDETSHEAASIGVTAFYCRLTPAEGLHFSDRTELTPMIFNYGDGAARSVDWTVDQHFESGWVTSRIPAHFMVRKHERRRERLQTDFNDPDRPTVVNGLGAPIKELRLADRNGRIFVGKNIPAGAAADLLPDNTAVASKGNSGLADTIDNFYRLFPDKINHAFFPLFAGVLIPNTYAALLDGCPFIENGLKDADNLNFGGVVFGIMESPGE